MLWTATRFLFAFLLTGRADVETYPLLPPEPEAAPALRDTTEAFDVQGHRGARGLLPENTIPGFLRALDLGVTTLEMDAVVTADSQVVLSHEPWFSSTICHLPSGEPVPADREEAYRIFEMPYEEVARFDCGSRGHPAFPEQEPRATSKPLLRDVIQAAEAYAAAQGLPDVRYNIETKAWPEWDDVLTPGPETFTRLLLGVLDETDVRQRATIQSFDPRTLQVARRLDPSLSLALLIGEASGLEENLAALGFTPAIYSPNHHLVDEDMVEAAHARGMLVIPWTVNTLEEMRRLKALGVDGLITDYPNRAQALVRRGGGR